MGVESPRALANAVFFENGKNLCLCGGSEHHRLKLSRFQFGSDYVEYTENGSNNRPGSYKDKRENKVVRYYADSSLGERCYVSLLKLHFSKLPDDVLRNSANLFYLQPKEEKPLSPLSWFKRQTHDRNSLNSVVKKACEQVGIMEETNHSLRATGATRLFESKVPEMIIQKRTRHASLDSVRLYERPSTEQQRAVSRAISSTEKIDYSDATDTRLVCSETPLRHGRRTAKRLRNSWRTKPSF